MENINHSFITQSLLCTDSVGKNWPVNAQWANRMQTKKVFESPEKAFLQ
jgi:hypothetical protein